MYSSSSPTSSVSRDIAKSNKKLVYTISIVAITVGAVLVILIVTAPLWQRTTVHSIPVPGYPGESIDFVLCTSTSGEYGYVVEFGDAITKRAFISVDVPVDEIKASSYIEYENETLNVYGPRGEQMSVPGFAP